MLAHNVISTLLVKLAQVAVTLALTGVLGYCVLYLKPAQWAFDSWIGAGVHNWFLDAMGSKDLRDMLDVFTLIWLSMTPSLAVWICVLLTRYLRQKTKS
ncbi:hypothetical protein N5D61_18720 [Pseudomonas sp. GD03842]|uniref:hypothetical protein n=1 Tax=Pseudomonas sp. GD03842 TaxID=2975385 RepID=UPI00244A69F8|nr:hypothetical protein [Pseudomonas sp. GD03842]MDH0748359.1 hypothetical protein [Pseudomonas sp. GD03842]